MAGEEEPLVVVPQRAETIAQPPDQTLLSLVRALGFDAQVQTDILALEWNFTDTDHLSVKQRLQNFRWLRTILESRTCRTSLQILTIRLRCGDNPLRETEQIAFRNDLFGILDSCEIRQLVLTTSGLTGLSQVLGRNMLHSFCQKMGLASLDRVTVRNGFIQEDCLTGIMAGLSGRSHVYLTVRASQLYHFSVVLDLMKESHWTGSFHFIGPIPEIGYSHHLASLLRHSHLQKCMISVWREHSRPLELTGLSEAIRNNARIRWLGFPGIPYCSVLSPLVLRDFLAGCTKHPTLSAIFLPDMTEEGVDILVEFLPSLTCEKLVLPQNPAKGLSPEKALQSFERIVQGCIYHPTLQCLETCFPRYSSEAVCKEWFAVIVRAIPSLSLNAILISNLRHGALKSSKKELVSAIRGQTALFHLMIFERSRRVVLPASISVLLARNRALAGVRPLDSHTPASLGICLGKLAGISSPTAKLSPMYELLRFVFVPIVLDPHKGQEEFRC